MGSKDNLRRVPQPELFQQELFPRGQKSDATPKVKKMNVAGGLAHSRESIHAHSEAMVARTSAPLSEPRIIAGAPAIVPHLLARFPLAPKSIWADVPKRDWDDWHWQQRNRITSIEQLSRVIRVSPDESEAISRTNGDFLMAITPYYAALMDPEDPCCPVRQQSVPTTGELLILPSDLDDPLNEDRDMPVPGVTHRYPDRVLFYLTHHCPVYCRHCTRKRKVAKPTSAAARRQIDEGLAYIAQHPEVRDVVISGGDPLSLSDERLDDILGRLRAIPHVEIVRIGTRNIVTLPQRITDSFVQMLRKHQPVYINTHFNHPKECTAEAFEAARKLADSGCAIGNQTVLLKGINDDPKTIKELNQKLLMMRIKPYYIYQCDLAKGISHFRTPIDKGISIMESLRGWTSGLAVPHFVIDAPGGGGKVPITPNYVAGRNGKKIFLRNYARNSYEYEEP